MAETGSLRCCCWCCAGKPSGLSQPSADGSSILVSPLGTHCSRQLPPSLANPAAPPAASPPPAAAANGFAAAGAALAALAAASAAAARQGPPLPACFAHPVVRRQRLAAAAAAAAALVGRLRPIVRPCGAAVGLRFLRRRPLSFGAAAAPAAPAALALAAAAAAVRGCAAPEQQTAT